MSEIPLILIALSVLTTTLATLPCLLAWHKRQVFELTQAKVAALNYVVETLVFSAEKLYGKESSDIRRTWVLDQTPAKFASLGLVWEPSYRDVLDVIIEAKVLRLPKTNPKDNSSVTTKK